MNSNFDTLLKCLPLLWQMLMDEKIDMTLELVVTPLLIKSLERAKKKWSYDREMFRRAMANRGCHVPVMNVLAYISLVIGCVPSLELAQAIVARSPFWNSEIVPRVYQFYGSWLRELDAGILLAQSGKKVTKNFKDDLDNGIDWMYDERVPVGISHQGGGSDRFNSLRKSEKMKSVNVLTAVGNGDGVHCVSLADIQALIKSSESDR